MLESFQGQIIAPALSAFPPSMAVTGHRDLVFGLAKVLTLKGRFAVQTAVAVSQALK
jgi:hypothetical protein